MGNRKKKLESKIDARFRDWSKTQDEGRKNNPKFNPASYRKPGSRKINQ